MSQVYQRVLEQHRIVDADDGISADQFAASAQWLETPGCVFQRNDFVPEHRIRTEGIIKAGLFVSIVLKGSGSGGVPQDKARFRYSDNTMVVMALRESTPWAGEAPGGASIRTAGLAFPRASIERMGLGQEFLDLFGGTVSSPFITSLPAPPRLLAIATEMISPTIGGQAGQLLLSAHATEILVRALSAIQTSASIDAVSNRTQWQMLAVKKAIDADLQRDWRVSELARQAGISRRSFNTHFYRLFGASASDYLRTRRLETARDAIVHNGCSVSEAAWLVGYSNPANFATAFRRHFGYAPSRDRA